MDKEELWKIYTAKNPGFLTKGFFFTPEYLKKFFDQTYDVGYTEGCDIGIYPTNPKGNEDPEVVKDIFRMFGM